MFSYVCVGFFGFSNIPNWKQSKLSPCVNGSQKDCLSLSGPAVDWRLIQGVPGCT